MKTEFVPRLIASFIITNLIFLGVILIASAVSISNYKDIVEKNNEIQNSLNEIQNLVQHASIDCAQNLLVRPSEILDSVGAKISILETRFGKNDPRVLEQKNLYVEIEYQHLQLIKVTKEKCRSNITIVFFFYSNEGDLEKESENMGFIVSSFKNKYPEKAMVYSFDTNLNSEKINQLKNDHRIESAPIVVLNERDKKYIRNINELEKHLDSDKVFLN